MLFFCFLTETIDSFRIFTEPYIMTGGGPGSSSLSIVQYLYESGFTVFKLGYASAIGYVLTLILLVISAAQVIFLRRQGGAVGGTGMSRRRDGHTPVHIILILWCALSVFPLLWMVGTSIKPTSEGIGGLASMIPRSPTAANYQGGRASAPGAQHAEQLHRGDRRHGHHGVPLLSGRVRVRQVQLFPAGTRCSCFCWPPCWCRRRWASFPRSSS